MTFSEGHSFASCRIHWWVHFSIWANSKCSPTLFCCFTNHSFPQTVSNFNPLIIASHTLTNDTNSCQNVNVQQAFLFLFFVSGQPDLLAYGLQIKGDVRCINNNNDNNKIPRNPDKFVAQKRRWIFHEVNLVEMTHKHKHKAHTIRVSGFLEEQARCWLMSRKLYFTILKWEKKKRHRANQREPNKLGDGLSQEVGVHV